MRALGGIQLLGNVTALSFDEDMAGTLMIGTDKHTCPISAMRFPPFPAPFHPMLEGITYMHESHWNTPLSPQIRGKYGATLAFVAGLKGAKEPYQLFFVRYAWGAGSLLRVLGDGSIYESLRWGGPDAGTKVVDCVFGDVHVSVHGGKLWASWFDPERVIWHGLASGEEVTLVDGDEKKKKVYGIPVESADGLRVGMGDGPGMYLCICAGRFFGLDTKDLSMCAKDLTMCAKNEQATKLTELDDSATRYSATLVGQDLVVRRGTSVLAQMEVQVGSNKDVHCSSQGWYVAVSVGDILYLFDVSDESNVANRSLVDVGAGLVSAKMLGTEAEYCERYGANAFGRCTSLKDLVTLYFNCKGAEKGTSWERAFGFLFSRHVKALGPVLVQVSGSSAIQDANERIAYVNEMLATRYAFQGMEDALVIAWMKSMAECKNKSANLSLILIQSGVMKSVARRLDKLVELWDQGDSLGQVFYQVLGGRDGLFVYHDDKVCDIETCKKRGKKRLKRVCANCNRKVCKKCFKKGLCKSCATFIGCVSNQVCQ